MAESFISPHNVYISTGLILEGIATVWDMKVDPNPAVYFYISY